jgi:hypothetical protein
MLSGQPVLRAHRRLMGMSVSFLASLAMSAVAFAQSGQVGGVQPTVTVALSTDDSISFRRSQDIVTDIDLHVGGAEYSVPLQCAGGLRAVRFETAEIYTSGGAEETAVGSFSLMFDMGNEQDRQFGKLPRVQLGFYRRRLTLMLVTTMTGAQSAFSSKLCSTMPVGPVTCRDTRELQGLAPDELVQQLRDLPTLPTPLRARTRPAEVERKRQSIYEELLEWGDAAIPSLVAGLQDPDVRLRRSAALALGALSGGWWSFECGPAKIDILSALPALAVALDDSDPDVRGWVAQAAGNIGADAASLVPVLIEHLAMRDEGSRIGACIALGQIGPAATAALPALRAALTENNLTLRSFAARAIQRIER